jgi:hypothetical protein
MSKIGVAFMAVLLSVNCAVAGARTAQAAPGVASARIALQEKGAAAVPAAGSLLLKTHGWHCRPAWGWDSRVGFRRWHRHWAACRWRHNGGRYFRGPRGRDCIRGPHGGVACAPPRW